MRKNITVKHLLRNIERSYSNNYPRRKSKTTDLLNNLKMNDDTYKLRRKVMNFIYEAKKMGDFPRVDVRITEPDKSSNRIAGVGRLNENIIWIPKDTLNYSEDTQREIVLHELAHTICGVGHDEKCPLMKSTIKLNHPMNKNQSLALFKKYLDERRRRLPQ